MTRQETIQKAEMMYKQYKDTFLSCEDNKMKVQIKTAHLLMDEGVQLDYQELGFLIGSEIFAMMELGR